jgi:cell division protein FtsB
MRSIQQHQDPLRLLSRRIVTIFLVVFVVTAISGLWSAYQKERESATLRHEADVQLADLIERSNQLHAKLSRLETDRGKEEALRERYDLGKSGENLVIIVDDPAPAEPTSTPSVFKRIRDALPWQ